MLRTLSVEERAGVARRGDLVRTPIFFAPGECRSLEDLAIVPNDSSADRPTIPFQADDVRRGPDGGISRAHLWFAVDLAAHATRRFLLLRQPNPGAANPEVVPVDASGRGVEIRVANGVVAFSREGGVESIRTGEADWRFQAEGALPHIRVANGEGGGTKATPLTVDRDSQGREFQWASGPLFAKVRTRVELVPGVVLEQEFRVPRHGREIVLTSALFPGADGAGIVKEHRLLAGQLAGPKGWTLVEVPAGVRSGLKAEHAYTVTALVREGAAALLAVPLVIGGANGRWKIEADGGLSLMGQGGLKRGDEGEKSTLHGYWTEVRLVPVAQTDANTLWSAYRAHLQPLVAVVDEPGAGVAALHAALADVVREMKPVGWRQEAGRAWVLGGTTRAAKVLQRVGAKEADEERLVRGAQNATAKLSEGGKRAIKEHEKGRAYGPLDPYHITYTQSAAAALAVLANAPASVSAVNLAMAGAVRRVGGKADRAGYPYIDCFARTLNMQMGPMLFGLTAGASAGRGDLVRFYRDLATAPPTLAVFGRGQRPYTGAPARSADQTDFLYQAICDFWLRAAELLADENLSLHPLAYARYTDCIDVMADRYHDVAARRRKNGEDPPARANFFRGQAHTHRWLGWSCAPYLRLLEDPHENAAIGLTEAIHHTRAQQGRWKNWPDLTYYVLADMLIRDGLKRSQPPSLPAGVHDVRVERTGNRTTVTWSPVAGAMEYRVYRSDRAGGPHVWLNSPYRADAVPALTATTWVDENGPADAVHRVVAVDAHGRASPWDDEPRPAPR